MPMQQNAGVFASVCNYNCLMVNFTQPIGEAGLKFSLFA